MKTSILFLVLSLAYAVSGQTATVIAEKANLRGTPSDKGKIVDKVSRDESVEVLKQSGVWFLVQTKDYAGWLPGNSIRMEQKTFTGEYPTIAEPNTMRVQDPPPQMVENPLFHVPAKPATAPSRTYIRGSRGGCYYLNSKGNKTYVDHSLCGG